jgi:hypothetical protein
MISKVKMSFLRSSSILQAFFRVANTLYHLSLSACRFYFLFRSFGEGGSLDSEFFGNAAVAEHFEPVFALAQNSGAQQSARVDLGAVFKPIERGKVYDLERLCENVVESSFGYAPCERHLAALEADAPAASGTSLLSLISAAGRFTVTGCAAPALALADLGAAQGGGKVI